MQKNKKRLLLLTFSLLTLVGCTNQETAKETVEDEVVNEAAQVEEVSEEDKKRQEKARKIEENISKFIDEEKYYDAVTHFKNSFINRVDKELEPTEKTIELYNYAFGKYYEEIEGLNESDYNLLLGSEYVNEDVTSPIYEKFSINIKEIEEVRRKSEEENREWREKWKVINEERKAEEAKNYVRIGMTKEEVLATNWGEPDDINKTITANHVSEQWVYDNYGSYSFLYFEDGVLVTIQN